MTKKLSLAGILAFLVAAGILSKGWFCERYPGEAICAAPSPTPTPSPTPEPTATPTPTPTSPPPTPSVPPSAPPTPTPVPTGTPPIECDTSSIPVGSVYVNAKEYGKRTKPNGEVIRTFDGTIKVHSAQWCAAHQMAAWGTDCPLAPEGDRCRNVRERYVLFPHVCPRFIWRTCVASCPGTFDILIGNPTTHKEEMQFINVAAGCPWPTGNEVVEAFWAQPEGKGTFSMWLWGDNQDGSPKGCGNTQAVDQ